MQTETAIPVIQKTISVADISSKYVSRELQGALIGKSSYLDNNGHTRKHLFSCDDLLKDQREFNQTCVAELQVIQSILQETDCSHFRIMS